MLRQLPSSLITMLNSSDVCAVVSQRTCPLTTSSEIGLGSALVMRWLVVAAPYEVMNDVCMTGHQQQTFAEVASHSSQARDLTPFYRAATLTPTPEAFALYVSLGLVIGNPFGLYGELLRGFPRS